MIDEDIYESDGDGTITDTDSSESNFSGSTDHLPGPLAADYNTMVYHDVYLNYLHTSQLHVRAVLILDHGLMLRVRRLDRYILPDSIGKFTAELLNNMTTVRTESLNIVNINRVFDYIDALSYESELYKCFGAIFRQQPISTQQIHVNGRSCTPLCQESKSERETTNQTPWSLLVGHANRIVNLSVCNVYCFPSPKLCSWLTASDKSQRSRFVRDQFVCTSVLKRFCIRQFTSDQHVMLVNCLVKFLPLLPNSAESPHRLLKLASHEQCNNNFKRPRGMEEWSRVAATAYESLLNYFPTFLFLSGDYLADVLEGVSHSRWIDLFTPFPRFAFEYRVQQDDTPLWVDVPKADMPIEYARQPAESILDGAAMTLNEKIPFVHELKMSLGGKLPRVNFIAPEPTTDWSPHQIAVQMVRNFSRHRQKVVYEIHNLDFGECEHLTFKYCDKNFFMHPIRSSSPLECSEVAPLLQIAYNHVQLQMSEERPQCMCQTHKPVNCEECLQRLKDAFVVSFATIVDQGNYIEMNKNALPCSVLRSLRNEKRSI